MLGPSRNTPGWRQRSTPQPHCPAAELRVRYAANLLWCSARVVALDFYKHLGLQTVGSEFEIEGIGPHYVMWSALVRHKPVPLNLDSQ